MQSQNIELVSRSLDQSFSSQGDQYRYNKFGTDKKRTKLSDIQVKVKGLLLIVFYIMQTVQIYSREMELLYTFIFTLMLVNSISLKRIDLIIYGLALLIQIVYYICQIESVFLASLLVSFTMMSFDFSIRLLRQCRNVINKISNLVINMTFLFFLCAYLGTAIYQQQKSSDYFQDFGDSILTLLRVQTLDDWGQIGREMEKEKESLFTYLFLSTFIFFLTYFYMNIMIGLMLDTINDEKKGNKQIVTDPFNYEKNQERLLEDILQLHLPDQIIIGKYYEIIVLLFSFGTVAFSVMHKFQDLTSRTEILLSYVDDTVYTIHFALLLMLENKIYQLERNSRLMMLLHVLAGQHNKPTIFTSPVSLLSSLFIDQNLGSLLNLLKVATTPSIKGIFRGTFKIFPMLLPSFMNLMAIMMIISALFTLYYPMVIGYHQQQYFVTFWNSLYTLLQIMTLDDWCAGIIPVFQDQGFIWPQIIIPLYIFVSNFIVLNILIAISCEYFVELKAFKVELSKSNERPGRVASLRSIQPFLSQSILSYATNIKSRYCKHAQSVLRLETRPNTFGTTAT